MNAPLVVFIVGPTASGKSSLGLDLAYKMDGEIINADSIQVYDGLDIGSAKPTPQELKTVTHHLIGHIEKGKKYTAGQFRDDVLNTLEDRISRGKKLFFIVGGSGFYLRALMTDLYPIPAIPEDVQKQIKDLSLEEQYKKLQILDPVYAKKISANDSYRIDRALEVCLTTGQKMSEIQKEFSQKTFPYVYTKVGITAPKDQLRQRVHARSEKMLEMGFVEEVKKIIGEGYGDWPALDSVGYKEVKLFLQGEIPADKLAEEITKSTMALVKKQMTWFKKDKEINWFDVGVDPTVVEEFLKPQIG